MIPFNDQQIAAIDKVVDWFGTTQDVFGSQNLITKPTFFFGGYAGTGKTSCAMEIAKRCVGDIRSVEFIAPTGKAASRLRQKGCKHARTMHQFTYNFRGEDPETGEPMFGPKLSIDGRPRLIVCDEFSMVGEYDYQNLLNHGIPILALGDIGQLPPVKAVPIFTADRLDVLLDKIERNAGKIVEASMYVRQGVRLPQREYDQVRIRNGIAPLDQLLEHVDENGQILCSYHKTREAVNANVRKALGYRGDHPEIGEKVVCRFNQHGFGIMNGEQGIVIGYKDARIEGDYDDDYPDEEDDGKRIVLKSLTDGQTITAKFNENCFSNNFEARKEAFKKPGAFDFGYALTVHSSQGSEWENVMVLEEVLRGVPHEQLLYTAVTRAQKRLTIYR